jgi:hypothetical protein
VESGAPDEDEEVDAEELPDEDEAEDSLPGGEATA